jgi:hypothetical protein
MAGTDSATVVLGLFQGLAHKRWLDRPTPPMARSLGPCACLSSGVRRESDARPQKNRRSPTSEHHRCAACHKRATPGGRPRSTRVIKGNGKSTSNCN